MFLLQFITFLSHHIGTNELFHFGIGLVSVFYVVKIGPKTFNFFITTLANRINQTSPRTSPHELSDRGGPSTRESVYNTEECVHPSLDSSGLKHPRACVQPCWRGPTKKKHWPTLPFIWGGRVEYNLLNLFRVQTIDPQSLLHVLTIDIRMVTYFSSYV